MPIQIWTCRVELSLEIPRFKGGRTLRSYLFKIPILELAKGIKTPGQACYRAKRSKLGSWDLSTLLTVLPWSAKQPPAASLLIRSNGLRKMKDPCLQVMKLGSESWISCSKASWTQMTSQLPKLRTHVPVCLGLQMGLLPPLQRETSLARDHTVGYSVIKSDCFHLPHSQITKQESVRVREGSRGWRVGRGTGFIYIFTEYLYCHYTKNFMRLTVFTPYHSQLSNCCCPWIRDIEIESEFQPNS